MLHPDFSDLEDEFGDVINILNEGRPEIPTERPSEMVWSSIAESLSVSSGPSPITDGPNTDPSAPASTDGPHGVNGSGAGSGAGSGDGSGDGLMATQPTAQNDQNVSPFRRPKDTTRVTAGRRFAVITAVAAPILLVAVPLSLALRGESLDQRAELVAIGETPTAAGTAELTDRTLAIDLEGLDPLEGADYELWLLDLEGDELQDLVSLGLVNEDGTFTVPDGIDLSQFSVVDVSVEPQDGNEAHSGNSVLRGPLSED
ncbi:MAG: anti-sigma factor [Actinomycetota bacterium]